MIARCRARGLEAEVGDFGRYETIKRFDLVTMQFGVYSYLAVQRSPKDVLEKATNLLNPEGVLLLDALNPYCVTYGPSGRRSAHWPAGCFPRFGTGGVVVRSYLGKSRTPVATATVTRKKLDRMVRSPDYICRSVWLHYSVTRVTRWLPGVLLSHLLVCAARGDRLL